MRLVGKAAGRGGSAGRETQGAWRGTRGVGRGSRVAIRRDAGRWALVAGDGSPCGGAVRWCGVAVVWHCGGTRISGQKARLVVRRAWGAGHMAWGKGRGFAERGAALDPSPATHIAIDFRVNFGRVRPNVVYIRSTSSQICPNVGCQTFGSISVQIWLIPGGFRPILAALCSTSAEVDRPRRGIGHIRRTSANVGQNLTNVAQIQPPCSPTTRCTLPSKAAGSGGALFRSILAEEHGALAGEGQQDGLRRPHHGGDGQRHDGAEVRLVADRGIKSHT